MPNNNESNVVPYEPEVEANIVLISTILFAASMVAMCSQYLEISQISRTKIAFLLHPLVQYSLFIFLYFNYKMAASFQPEYSGWFLSFLALSFEIVVKNRNWSSTLFFMICSLVYGNPYVFHCFFVKLMDQYLSLKIALFQGVVCEHRQDGVTFIIPNHINYPLFQRWYVHNVTYIISEGAKINNIVFSTLTHPAKIVIEPNVTVEESSFRGMYMEEIEVGSGSIIRAKAFKSCMHLKKIIVSIDANIERDAFTGCNKPKVYMSINQTHLKSFAPRLMGKVKQQLVSRAEEISCKVKRVGAYMTMLHPTEEWEVQHPYEIGLAYCFMSSGFNYFKHLPPKALKKLVYILWCFSKHKVVIPDHVVLRHILKVPSVKTMVYYKSIKPSNADYINHSVRIEHSLLRN